MSASVGIFTHAYGVGPGTGQQTLNPLPVREQGAYIGRGRAAGHRVQLADWAYLIEAAEQRAIWGTGVYDTIRHDVYPHNTVDRYYNAQGTETYNTEITISPPSSRAWSAVTVLDNGRFFNPDATPPAYNDVFWRLNTATDDRPNYLYSFCTPSHSAGSRLRRVDDVRCLFYDLKSCTRCDTINGSYIYYDNGSPAGSMPRVDTTGPYRADDPDHAVRYDADECRVSHIQGTLDYLLNMHHEVVQHADFAATPAYAIVQLRCAQTRTGVGIVRNYARYVRTSWTLNAQTGVCTVDLAACGCDTSGLITWMNSAVDSYVTGDSYRGTAEVVDLVYDLTMPVDRGLFYGWTWEPNAA